MTPQVQFFDSRDTEGDNSSPSDQGQLHTIPSKGKDTLTLQQSYEDAGYHKFLNRQGIPQEKDKAKDYTARGYALLHAGKVIEHWRGLPFEHARAERLGCEHASGSNSESEVENNWSDGGGERREEGGGKNENGCVAMGEDKVKENLEG